jgi:ABC-type sugar transport system substrate-binding protein
VLKDHPGIKLLDQQTANWDRTAAFPVMQTWLARYGKQITAVWAANDDMALGALEALRAAGLAGRIPVVGVDGIPEAVAAIARHGAAYLAATGGAAYLLSKAITASRVVAFEDLGMEAIHEFALADFPVTVAVDAAGTSVHRFAAPPVWLRPG